MIKSRHANILQPYCFPVSNKHLKNHITSIWLIIYRRDAPRYLCNLRQNGHGDICQASLQKGPDVAKKKKSVLAQIFTKLGPIYKLHNFNNYN